MRVEYIRDGLSEESHNIDYTGRLLENERIYYMRSCAKPLQASLLIDYQADLSPEELALCSGSHSGEECHIKIAEGIMKKYSLKENMLKCGIHEPLSASAREKLREKGETCGVLHNNCSGKHLGFLVLCKINDWDTQTYYMPEHPLQTEVRKKINRMCGVNTDYPVTTDGCGVPILSMPLKNMTIGFKNLLSYPKIIGAIRNNPYIYGGEGRLDTEIIQKTANLIAKVGAGGLCIVLNTKTEECFGLKVDDCSMEARRIAVLEIINRLGWGKIEYDNKIRTLQGKIVGEKRVVFE